MINREARRVYNAAYYCDHRDERAKRHSWFTKNLNVLRAAQGCDECGNREGRLDHHHINPDTKLYAVSHMSNCSMEKFLDEIAKCTVLCRSCHNTDHDRSQNFHKERLMAGVFADD